jgi:transcriptional regulator with GAF, ATPase, and Fis domain
MLIPENGSIEQIKHITKQQFDALYQISSVLNSAVYEGVLINETLDLIIKVLNAERGLFVKFNDEQGSFSIISARNLQKESIEDLSAFSSGILQQVIDSRTPQLYHDVQSHPFISQFESIQIHNIKSVIGVPVFFESQIWGVILVDSSLNRREFTDENLVFISFFSNMVSLALKKIIKYEELQNENRILQNQLQATRRIPEIIGESPVMQNMAALLHKVAATDATVLLVGESGTGKELVARAIHNLSMRKDKPYLAQFCGSIPDTLLESELFGYKKGAFTGANNDKKGLFEVANNGTFFLDEIADISFALQAKMLRVLQNREIMRLGDTSFIKVDVRIIAATNKDLKQLSKENKFREDLFYRLNVFPIRIPPLRERRGDIPLLIKHLIKKYSVEEKGITGSALKLLESYNWPGNVRQLENVIQRGLILCEGDKILPEHIVIEEDSDSTDFQGTLKEFEKSLLIKRLKEFDGNRTLTAQSLGVSVRWVQLKLKEIGVN